MKLLYITSVDFNNPKFSGVRKKIDAQVRAFTKNGIISKLINFPPVKNGILSKLNRRLNPFSSNSYIDLNRDIEFNDFDILYLRYTLCDYKLLKLLDKAKKNNPNIKIMVEIPTFPYCGEYKSLNKKSIIIKDKIFRNRLQKYVDKIITFSNDDEIYNIKTIKINNGIELSNIPLSEFSDSDEETINIIAVANVCFWHGYDRLIRGIYEFYKKPNEKRKVNFYIIGGGEELENLKSMTTKLHLNDRVHFEGFKSGDELNCYFDKCDIAVDHLGLHRKGMNQLSSLKSKEYTARGIPFILSHKDLAFLDFEYIKQFDANEESINIDEIFSFKNQIYTNKNLKEEIRAYSKRFDWINVTKEIKDKI